MLSQIGKVFFLA